MGECQSVKEATDLNDCPQSAQDWNLFNYISLNVLYLKNLILDFDWINVPNLAKINTLCANGFALQNRVKANILSILTEIFLKCT